MKKIFFVFGAILTFLISGFAHAQEKKAVYFYSDTCPHCQKVDKYFKDNGIYEKYDIEKHDVLEMKNQVYLNNVFDKLNIPIENRGIPAILIEDEMLIGDKDIISQFEEKMGGGVASKIESTNGELLVDVEKEGVNQISLPILVSAALVDAINPCAFAVLIILLATITHTKGRKQTVAAGLIFSAAIFISYFLMGLGVYRAITLFDLPKIFSLLVGTLAILIGLANLKDAFWHGKGFLMEVPESWRPKMKSILNHVTSPLGAGLAGIVVSLFLLPCTSGPYLVILGLLAEKVDMVKSVSLLAFYNLIFILPMIIITFAVGFFQIKTTKLEKIRKNNIELLHGIAGVIMLLIGIYLVKGWI